MFCGIQVFCERSFCYTVQVRVSFWFSKQFLRVWLSGVLRCLSSRSLLIRLGLLLLIMQPLLQTANSLLRLFPFSHFPVLECTAYTRRFWRWRRRTHHGSDWWRFLPLQMILTFLTLLLAFLPLLFSILHSLEVMSFTNLALTCLLSNLYFSFC